MLCHVEYEFSSVLEIGDREIVCIKYPYIGVCLICDWVLLL